MTGQTKLLTWVVLLSTAQSLQAQITIQQPVLERFSVNTTVVVPDSGGAYLGGLKRAGESRKEFGPLPSGTSTGLFREHAGVSVHVFIHDFAELDQLALGLSPSGSSFPANALSGSAAYAFSVLSARPIRTRSSSTKPVQRGGDSSGLSIKDFRRTGATKNTAPVKLGKQKGDPRASRYYQLGLAAKKRGRESVARLHFRLAEKYGSTRAKLKLKSAR
jgi:hypothetical protein